MNREIVNHMGMELERWTNESCVADFGIGNDSDGNWATLYSIKSSVEGKGHATALLLAAKKHYEKSGKTFGGTVALNERMRRIYQRLKIHEYA